MKKIMTLLLICMSWGLHANELEKLVLKELPGIAALYADGYARLVEDSLAVKTLYNDKEGECTLIAAFKMEAFNGAPNFTQFVSFFNCPVVHRVLRPNKKLFMSDLFRYYMGDPYLDISTAVINGDQIQVKGHSGKNKSPLVTVFEPSPGPGWWRLKETQKMEIKKDEVLSPVHGRF